MSELPGGTVTFLLTDVEGSTRLWERHPAAMRAAMARHDSLIGECAARCGGAVVRSRGEGDSAFCVFPQAAQAIAAALAIQQALRAEPWPEETVLRVRVGLHSGAAELRESDYYGSPVNRCARIRSLAAGDQILLSCLTAGLARDELPAGASLRDLGRHQLKDLEEPEQLFQLVHPDLPSEFPPPRSLGSLPNNLPKQLTRFIGREEEVDRARELLSTTRLLTITGPGGGGKTRLSLQVAAEVIDQYSDGAWFVELSSLTGAGLVAQTIARTLSVREAPGQPIDDTLRAWLGDRELLLVLDNCEHVLDGCIPLADTLLRGCAGLRILASSREPLGIAGESVYPLAPLRVPSLKLLKPIRPELVEILAPYESIRLFVERARAAVPSFELTDRNAPAVVQTCHLLDGLPLAIELAAAKVRVLAPEQIAARLDDRFRLLTGGSRAAPTRQQTLRAAIDWSHALLQDKERTLLRRLSVFAGGFTLEAAEGVCADSAVAGDAAVEQGAVLDLVDGLVSRSLVTCSDTDDGEVRYGMLESIREYAAESLEQSGEEAAVRTRHRDWFLALAERAEAELQGSHQAEWLERLEREHDNLRASMQAARAATEGETTGLRFVASLWWFWYVRGHLFEGFRQANAAVDRYVGPPVTEVARALNALGNLARPLGEYETARTALERCRTVWEALGHRRGIAACLNNLALVSRDEGTIERARELYSASLEVYRELDYEPGVVTALGNLGATLFDLGEYEAARPLFEECLAIQRRRDDRWQIASMLQNLAFVTHRAGELDLSAEYHREALRIGFELQDRFSMANWLGNLALLERDRGALGLAVCLLGAANAARARLGVALPPADCRQAELDLESLRESLPQVEFDAAWISGRSMTLEQAVEAIIHQAVA